MKTCEDVRMWIRIRFGFVDESSYPNLGLAQQAVSRDEGYYTLDWLMMNFFSRGRSSQQLIHPVQMDIDGHSYSKPSEKNSDTESWSLHASHFL